MDVNLIHLNPRKGHVKENNFQELHGNPPTPAGVQALPDRRATMDLGRGTIWAESPSGARSPGWGEWIRACALVYPPFEIRMVGMSLGPKRMD